MKKCKKQKSNILKKITWNEKKYYKELNKKHKYGYNQSWRHYA